MTTVRFAKLHGLGNDFLVVDLRAHGADAAAQVQDPDVVRWLCDRQFGVGGDGVLAVSAPTTPGAVATMRVLNADGTEAEMCGNGIRCVAKVLREADPSLGDRLVIDTGAGPLTCQTWVVDGEVDSVTVDMGRPRLTRAEIPMGPDALAGERCVDAPFAIAADKTTRAVTAVSMGNPHAVFFADDAPVMTLARALGPGIEVDPTFPRRTNVEFAAVAADGSIELAVWERGCGITLACGTGACATAVAACLTGRARPGAEITVRLPGGALGITVAADYSGVAMRGPARLAFQGEVDLDRCDRTRRP